MQTPLLRTVVSTLADKLGLDNENLGKLCIHLGNNGFPQMGQGVSDLLNRPTAFERKLHFINKLHSQDERVIQVMAEYLWIERMWDVALFITEQLVKQMDQQWQLLSDAEKQNVKEIGDEIFENILKDKENEELGCLRQKRISKLYLAYEESQMIFSEKGMFHISTLLDIFLKYRLFHLQKSIAPIGF